MSPRIARDRAELARALAELRAGGGRVALVPTMGALHAGHLALVARAGELAERVVVSIFVNPTQFAPGEDFERYPRTPEADLAALGGTACHLVFMPASEAIYPFGTAAAVRVHVPGLSGILCGASRPGHFDGVASVVLRLFHLVRPEIAVFGEKDYQQLLLVRRLVGDLGLGIEIVGVPTVRDADGLAMSSRNAYLAADERRRAAVIPKVLRWMAEAWLAGGERTAIEAEGRARLAAGGLEPEYAVLRRAGDLGEPAPGERPARALVAARVGRTRLIDNWPIP